MPRNIYPAKGLLLYLVAWQQLMPVTEEKVIKMNQCALTHLIKTYGNWGLMKILKMQNCISVRLPVLLPPMMTYSFLGVTTHKKFLKEEMRISVHKSVCILNSLIFIKFPVMDLLSVIRFQIKTYLWKISY